MAWATASASEASIASPLLERRWSLRKTSFGQPLALHGQREDVGAERVVRGLREVKRAEAAPLGLHCAAVTFF